MGMTDKVRAMSSKELIAAHGQLRQKHTLGGLTRNELAALTVIRLEMHRRMKK